MSTRTNYKGGAVASYKSFVKRHAGKEKVAEMQRLVSRCEAGERDPDVQFNNMNAMLNYSIEHDIDLNVFLTFA